eukprot:4114343-Prymnesium_polylepis.1
MSRITPYLDMRQTITDPPNQPLPHKQGGARTRAPRTSQLHLHVAPHVVDEAAGPVAGVTIE